MRIGLNITDYSGKWQKLSSDLYKIVDASGTYFENDPDYGTGCMVRLISGVDDSVIVGYHFNNKFVTVCSENVTTAQLCGFEKTRLEKVTP